MSDQLEGWKSRTGQKTYRCFVGILASSKLATAFANFTAHVTHSGLELRRFLGFRCHEVAQGFAFSVYFDVVSMLSDEL